MAKAWIRLYTNVPDNAKAQSLPPPLFKFWVNCLCLYGDKGYFPTIQTITWKMKISEKVALKNIRDLIEARLLEEDPGDKGFEGILFDALTPHDWDELQFESDSSTERVKKHRDRYRKPKRNVSVTPPDTEQKQIQKQTQNRAEEPIEMTPALDEQFQEYQRLFGLVGNPIPEDFANGSFCWRSWCRLDFEQRKIANDGLGARHLAGMTVLHTPDSYLTKNEYKRPLRRAAANGNGRMSAADRIDKAFEAL